MLKENLLLLTFLVVVSLSSSLGDQKSLAVTIYNNQFAMVKDVRSFTFDKGNSYLYFTDVSSNIQTETVTFKPIGNLGAIRVFQQNFQNNLIDTNSILKKYIEKEVELFVTLGDTSKRVKGKLLGYNSGYILQTAYGINVFNKIDAIQFSTLPDGFFTTPTLNWKVSSEKGQTVDCEVAYRTTGFSWKSDYSVILNAEQTKADIGGWVTIDNNSGKKYVNAKLKLIAGQVNTVSNQPEAFLTYARAPSMSMKVNDAAPSFSQKSFADFHLYTLSQPVTLNESSQKQVEFIPKVYNVPIRKYNYLTISAGGYSSQKLKASNKIDFTNNKSNGLGIPFPKGTVRVFKEDEDDGSLQFVGQDSINHTPKDQNITLTTGNSFDIAADLYSQTRVAYDNGGYSAIMNITIRNHKQTAAQVEVHLNQYYGDNLKISWDNPQVKLVKVTSTQYKFVKTLKADQTFVAKWKQDYYP